MEVLMFKKLLFLPIIFGLIAPSANAMEHLISPKTTKQIITVSTEFLKTYSLAYCLTYAHELGHAVTAKIIKGETYQIAIDPILPINGISGTEVTNETHFSTQSYAQRDALTSLAGPVAGLLATIGSLKVNTILYEYFSNNKSFKQAVLQGFRASLFNQNQSIGFQLAAAVLLFSNINALIDISDPDSDISQCLKSLNISNPAFTGNHAEIIIKLPLCMLAAVSIIYLTAKNITRLKC